MGLKLIPIAALFLNAFASTIVAADDRQLDQALLSQRISPDEIENYIYQRIAEQTGLKLTSVSAVECDIRQCRVTFTGLDPNPQYVGESQQILSMLMDPPWERYQPTSGSAGTQEIAPGVRAYVTQFTYVAIVESSADPTVAAYQKAACAGAWARVSEQRGSDDYLRAARVRAAEFLEQAAVTLGRDEAQRVAERRKYGPVTRECGTMPY